MGRFMMRWLRSALVSMLLLAATTAHAVEPVTLDDAAGSIDLWPAVTILHEVPGKALAIEDVISRRAEFVAPRSAYAALGLEKGVVWMKFPLRVAASSDGHWILEFEYTLLNHVDVYVVDGNGLRETLKMGNAVALAARPLPSRTHAAQLQLKRGEDVELLARIDTIGTKIAPVRISKIGAFHAHGLNEHILQGILISVSLCLLLYAVLKWLSLRENLYGKYALLVFCSTLFSVHFFGIGAMYLWTDIQWIERHLAGITSLTAAAVTALFIEDALGDDLTRRLRQSLKVVAAIMVVAACLHAIDVISIQTVGIFMGTLGLAPALMGLPGAIKRERRGDSTGAYFIIAWVGYFIASAVMVGVVKGYVGANFWTMHSFQFGSTLDVLIFMRIAVLRSEVLHRAAEIATRERASLITMAQSDPLTGLMNRRGLNDVLERELANVTPTRPIALFVLDLDNFKPVNDNHGHDVGDQLLITVASRLRNCVRAGDAVARLGGDEFVVMAGGLTGDGQAADLGQKLLDCFVQPVAVAEREFAIGATIGYAIAPIDGVDAERLLKIADTGLYAGKQAGRHQLTRGVARSLSASGVD
jgi:diguanylate cyclase (GGDEF)-like protein